MTAARVAMDWSRIEPVIAELQKKIIVRYPEAQFEIFEGDDPRGTYLRAIVDVEDTDVVVDLVVDQLLDLQIEEQLPVYFVTRRPRSRQQMGRSYSRGWAETIRSVRSKWPSTLAKPPVERPPYPRLLSAVGSLSMARGHADRLYWH